VSVHLQESALDPWEWVQRHQAEHTAIQGKFGATSVFVGTMRDFNQGQQVEAMTLEHYPAMTQKQLETICDEARQQWQVLELLVVHRYGAIKPNDPIVLVAVWSGHREHAFKACRYVIDALKTRAPFWKQEQTADGRHWVEQEG